MTATERPPAPAPPDSAPSAPIGPAGPGSPAAAPVQVGSDLPAGPDSASGGGE
ncbi:hypothetical protein [Actinomyces sp. oral taxon 414]|uniref:hypothetical protein n=1 Tax=Actinomyces sp. oral taxon 414 TaxID=712122 RepID=UPI000A473128|nr:hypothetical protein [Actinomyces sp. oral taxon 414]